MTTIPTRQPWMTTRYLRQGPWGHVPGVSKLGRFGRFLRFVIFETTYELFAERRCLRAVPSCYRQIRAKPTCPTPWRSQGEDEESEDDADYAPDARGGSDAESSSDSDGDAEEDSDDGAHKTSQKRPGTASAKKGATQKKVGRRLQVSFACFSVFFRAVGYFARRPHQADK